MSQKIKIDSNVFPFPMPMSLVGALVEGRPNFLAVAWVNRVNYKPALIAIALGKGHHTNKGIHEQKAFSVNIPGVDLLEKADYCGLVSGAKKDKASLFEVFYGDFKVPLIKECPVCMECVLTQAIDLEMDTLFIGEIKNAFSEERYLTDGFPDPQKVKPFMLTMPGNGYWPLGERIGKAWEAGKKLIK